MVYIPGFYQPKLVSVNDPNSGFALQRADDSVGASQIATVSNHFVSTVTPVTDSNNNYNNGSIYIPPNLYNAQAPTVLHQINNYANTITPINSSAGELYRLPYDPYAGAAGVPDVGIDPNASTILSASTQFQADLQTVGVPYSIGNSTYASAPAAAYGGSYYSGQQYQPITSLPAYSFSVPTVPAYPWLQSIQPTQTYSTSTTNSPVYSSYPPYSSYPTYPTTYPTSYPTGTSYPTNPPGSTVPTSTTTSPLANAVAKIRQNPYLLPGYIPLNVSGGVSTFLNNFNQQFNEGDRVQYRQLYNNPTTVNQNALNAFSIQNAGGAYNQGSVINPFNGTGFITDTNPYAKSHAGLLVTNGNGNGAIKGTPAHDVLIGRQDVSNVIDGQGGQDDIFGGNASDLIQVRPGDHVTEGAGNDTLFYDFTDAGHMYSRQTTIDGGAGNNTLVLTVGENPTTDAGSPLFRTMTNGNIAIDIDGQEILTRNITHVLITDATGNIGARY